MTAIQSCRDLLFMIVTQLAGLIEGAMFRVMIVINNLESYQHPPVAILEACPSASSP
jgi:hypothetical protein